MHVKEASQRHDRKTRALRPASVLRVLLGKWCLQALGRSAALCRPPDGRESLPETTGKSKPFHPALIYSLRSVEAQNARCFQLWLSQRRDASLYRCSSSPAIPGAYASPPPRRGRGEVTLYAC